MIEKIIEKMAQQKCVEAIALGGSRAIGNYDKSSDYDIYVYLKDEFIESERRALLDPFAKYMEYSNSFWELEDDGILNNGVEIEFIYRRLEDVIESMENLFVKGYIGNGYTTCFVDNLLHSKVLYDASGKLDNIRKKYSKELTPDFYDKVISYNMSLLMDKMPSLFYQIQKAIKREDILSMNHRSTALFEIYFEIIYAMNRRTHPGEKRLLEMASLLNCTPKDFDLKITKYFKLLYVEKDKSLALLYEIICDLYDLLNEKEYDFPMNSYKNKR